VANGASAWRRRRRRRRHRRRDAPARSDVVLDVAGLRAAYGHVPVLHGITFALHAGEAVGIVGHNGVGKTTFLKALIGLVPATAGRISIDGIDVTRMKAHDRSRLGIGYVPQGAASCLA
jgi:ABC-type branched-subunit amino acid transport system ATPase component